MKTSMYKSILLSVALGMCIALPARENVNSGPDPGSDPNGNGHKIMTGCLPGKTQTELKLNDVRTRILTDGDMWWDLNNAKYEIPKGSNSMAQFAGSLWFGGFHNGGLRVSAMTYRQSGVDFWPGPIDPSTIDVDPSVCTQYDKHYIFNRTDVDNFYAYWAQHGSADPSTPSWIKDYPGTYDYGTFNETSAGQPLTINYLAPFNDNNGDGHYNYADGDYPNYNVTGANTPRGQCVRRLFGDETIFWVFNDKGNNHKESGSSASIGVEIRAQAFEFSTGDELNQMSFYNYEVINWSADRLDSTYFTVWDDCDLGWYLDDYIGCDVKRGLGYQYNGDNYDDDGLGFTGYHNKLPAIGCDFFQGPYADMKDGIDNDRDSCIDCTWKLGADGKPDYSLAPDPDNVLPEQIIMSRFTYYTNTGNQQTGNPTTSGNGIQYYNFMNGKWKDGTLMTYGNNGTTPGNQPCFFLFPGVSDPNGWGLGYQPGQAPVAPNGSFGTTGWTQQQALVSKNDMRFLISCGKFTLQPGAVNYVTYGMPFARSNSADNFAPVALLQTADDKAQALFDNCFKVLDGPDAPDLTIQEISNQLLITVSNNPYTSNNYEAKRYSEPDATIQPLSTLGHAPDNLYRFEGYIIYQLRDETVGPADLYNADKARVVFQCDVRNGVKQLVNYITDPTLGLVPQLMVNGLDNGIQNSLTITGDKFAASDPRLVNFRNYYFMAVSYAYNNYLTYVPNTPPTAGVDTMPPHSKNNPGISFNDPTSGDYNGQKRPFLLGRRNIKVYTGIPHDPTPEAYGTTMNSSYGIGPMITRVEGQGNGGLALDLTDQSISDILNSATGRFQKVTYIGNRGPINVKVTDPLRVVKGDFTLKFVGSSHVKVGADSLWQYLGNAPVASPALLDSGKIKNDKKIRWYMTGTYTDASGNHVNKTWLSDEGINLGQEKIMTGVNNEPLGFSITVRQTTDPYQTARINVPSVYATGAADATDLLESSITFANTSTPWLGGVKDFDGTNFQDWILSGGSGTDISGIKAGGKSYFADAAGIWEKVVNGTWAPWRFVKMTQNDWAPGYVYSSAKLTSLNTANYCDTRLLSSVDIVFTSNTSLWSRCPVIDMNTQNDPHTGIPYKWQLRRAKSVDKNGVANFPSVDNNDHDSSMSWFPGYAINVETGEHLNICFAENSADSVNRGRDMMWNPTKNITDATGAKAVHGGMHYVYVFGHNSDGNFTNTTSGEVVPSDIRRYDKGESLYRMLNGFSSWPRDYSGIATGAEKAAKWSLLSEVFKDIMWVTMPLSANGIDIYSPHAIPCDVKVRIRVNKPYRYALSTVCSPAYSSKAVASLGTLSNSYTTTPTNSDSTVNAPADLVSSPENGNFPMYKFNTNDLAPKSYDASTAKNALAKINIVPNPYYGHSGYEKTRIDNVVKIINLPVKCKIRIYTLAGTLIRTVEKDNDQTYLDWDLKNDKNVQVASGLYILHIDAPGIGERIIKWFGVMRPYDLQSY